MSADHAPRPPHRCGAVRAGAGLPAGERAPPHLRGAGTPARGAPRVARRLRRRPAPVAPRADRDGAPPARGVPQGPPHRRPCRPLRPVPLPEPLPGDRRRRGRGRQAQGPLHERRPAPDRPRLRPLAGPRPPRGVRGAPRVARERPGGAPRGRAAGREPHGRVAVPGAREVRQGPHLARPGTQARPGDRPRRRDPPGGADPLATDQEQPGLDRGPGRREDRRGGGARAADRDARRARFAAGEAARGARSRFDPRRCEVPGRVRGAPEGGAPGDRAVRRPGDPVHRRAPHARPRRGDRGRGAGRFEPSETRARPGHPPLHRRHDDPGVPPVHREGRRARASVPAGDGHGADRRGHDLDPPRAQGALRAPPRGPDPGRGAGRRGDPLRPLHLRPPPARQGDRRDRRGGVDGPAHSRLATERARPALPSDPPARDRADRARAREGPGEQGAVEAAREGAREPQGAGDRAPGPLEEGEGRGRTAPGAPRRPRPGPGRRGEGRAVGRSGGGGPPPLRHGAGSAEAGRRPHQGDRGAGGGGAPPRGGRGRGRGARRLEVERGPRQPDARGGDPAAPAHGGDAAGARGRPGRGDRLGLEGRPPLALGSRGPEPADRGLPLPRSHRRRQDRAREGARRLPLPHREGARADRHERVHGEAHRRPLDRGAAGLRRLRGGRAAHRGGPHPAVHGHPLRRGGEGARRRGQRPPAAHGRRTADRRAGPDRGLPQHPRDHDQQPRLRSARGRHHRRRLASADRAGAERALPPRVPEPARRGGALPRPHGDGDRPHRRPAARSGRGAAARPEDPPRRDGRGPGAPGPPGLRSAVRSAPAEADDPAARRRPADHEGPRGEVRDGSEVRVDAEGDTVVLSVAGGRSGGRRG